jgi:hypothetical protein
MSSTESNSGLPQEEVVEVIEIDLEEHFNNRWPHPEPHPRKKYHYRVRINEDLFVLRYKETGEIELLALVGKTPEKDQLFQIVRDGEGKREIEITPGETIDLSRQHPEKFITREKVFCFFISKKEYRTHREELTVRQILEDFAKVSTTTHTLAERRPGGIHEFKNLNESLLLKDCPHFTIFDNSPTGLS